VFLLLLCNDRSVLGPWVNRVRTNVFAGSVVAALITLSVVLTVSVLVPSITGRQIELIMIICAGVAVLVGVIALVRVRRSPAPLTVAVVESEGRNNWRMPPLNTLSKPQMSRARKIGLTALRCYLAGAMILVVVKIVEEAIGHLFNRADRLRPKALRGARTPT
jgi:hypothetical protein